MLSESPKSVVSTNAIVPMKPRVASSPKNFSTTCEASDGRGEREGRQSFRFEACLGGLVHGIGNGGKGYSQIRGVPCMGLAAWRRSAGVHA